MPETKTCPRCSECANSDHHWMETDGLTGTDNPWPCYECKHCEAIGAECPRCHADDERSKNCLRCEGEGIVNGTAFLCDGWPVVESDSEAAGRAYETMYASPVNVVPAEIAGRCEGCWGLILEGTDYMTDRDGDGKWCRECGEDEGASEGEVED